MPYCPRCKKEFESELTSCPQCGYDFSENDHKNDQTKIEDGWIVIAKINDKTSADYAIETLRSYDIPAVVISESGFFGQIGLNLPSLTGKNIGQFKIYIQPENQVEAEDILKMILGDNWVKNDK